MPITSRQHLWWQWTCGSGSERIFRSELTYSEVPTGGALVVVVVRDAPVEAALVHVQVAEVQVPAERVQRVHERVSGGHVRRVRQVHAADVRRMPQVRRLDVRLASLENPVAGLLEGRKFIILVQYILV